VLPAKSYTASEWVYSTPGYGSVSVAIDWFDAAGVYITTNSTAAALGAATWANRTVTATSPGNAASASWGPTLLASPPNGTALFVDDVDFSGPSANNATLTVSYRNAWR
jgi:hypothetical protein